MQQQPIEGHADQDRERRLEQIGDNAAADEIGVRQEVRGGGGCIARRAQRIPEREPGGDGG
jgi:hypothetical protein